MHTTGVSHNKKVVIPFFDGVTSCVASFYYIEQVAVTASDLSFNEHLRFLATFEFEVGKASLHRFIYCLQDFLA
jgi:hypothetical protein